MALPRLSPFRSLSQPAVSIIRSKPMSDTPKKQSDKQRRDFLRKLSAFSAAVGVTSASSLVMGQTKDAPKITAKEAPKLAPANAALATMVTHAIDKGDVELAIKEHNTKAKL